MDFAFPASKVIVEVDGWDVHGTRGSFEADRARDAELAAQGWPVLRFTWLMVTRQPARVAARLAEVLAMRRAA